MKLTFIAFALLVCFATSTFAAKTYIAPAIPDLTKSGYTGYNLAQVKKNSIILNTYISQAARFIINSINAKKIAPASYSVFLRYAYRKATEAGYEIVYYAKTYDPKNKNGKAYFGFFAVQTTTTGGSRKFLRYNVTHSYPRAQLVN